ncbi:hypothetical protein [Streptomyces sp. NPDC046805]|uniref:hypothetical protein n=1 Tax=Streptomyces sp. NPDC046805 TaxID=3155134 RepID=UPI0034019F73
MVEAIVVESVTEAEPVVVESVVEAEPAVVEAIVAEAAPVVAEALAGDHMGVHGWSCCSRAGRGDRSAASHQNGG